MFADVSCAFALLLALAAYGALVTPVEAADVDAGSILPALGAKVTYVGDATGTGAAEESLCQEDINCDTFTLTVNGSSAQWAGKLIDVKITWSISANDYDLYLHKGSDSGPTVGVSAGGAPETSEEAVIDPSATGVGVYSLHTVYFATTPSTDQYNATVKVQPGSPTFDPLMRRPIYRCQPDGLTGQVPPACSFQTGADGGGDVDLAVGRPNPVTHLNPNPATLVLLP